MHFLEIIKQQLFYKPENTKQCMAFFFHIEALLSLKNAWLPQIFSFDTKGTCQALLSLHNFKLHKNIPVLGCTTNREPEYLVMHRTYAQ